MISNLNEINRVLFSVQNLTSGHNRVQRNQLIEHLKGEVILGRNPEFGSVIDFVLDLGLTSSSKTGIGLSDLGRELLAVNTSHIYELQQDQRKFLVRKCYLDGPVRSKMKQFARTLSLDSAGDLVWSPIDSEPLGDIEWLTNHLLQLGLLKTRGDLLVVSRGYVDTVLQFLDEGADYTEEQFERYLRDKRLVGEIAESFVLEFERDRLKKSGHKLESVCVQHVSKLRVNAGFDVCSFDGSSKALTHDRYIEVKGSGQPTVRFIWTANEMKKASELRERYWIYFVGGIDRKRRLIKREPVMVQDPHNALRLDPRFKLNYPDGVVVEGKVSGQPLVPAVRVRR